MTPSPSAKRFSWRNLGVRLVSALVLAPSAVAAAWFGGWPFLLMVGVGASLLCIEWALMSAPRTPTRLAAVLTAAVVGPICVLYSGLATPGARLELAAWALVAVGMGAAALAAKLLKGRSRDASFGVFYLAAPALALIWLRGSADDQDGRYWTLLVLAVAWAADSAAFMAGSAFKGPKLWPSVSPNKTWSGFAGGLVAGAAAAWAVAELTDVPRNAWIALLAGLLSAAATMGGDLFESMIKRRFGVKDSGDLIPGHGGLLDRIDGLMVAILAMAVVRLVIETGLLG